VAEAAAGWLLTEEIVEESTILCQRIVNTGT